MKNTVILNINTVCADNCKLTLLWVSLFCWVLRRRLHDSVFNTKTNSWSLFWPKCLKYCLLMENTCTVILNINTVCADNSKLTLLWVSLFCWVLRRHLHDSIFNTKQTFGHHFGLPFTCKRWKRILKTETFESGDLSGDLENGYLKNG